MLAQTSKRAAAFFSIRNSSRDFVENEIRNAGLPGGLEHRSLPGGSTREPLSYGTSGSARSRWVSLLCDAGFLGRGCTSGQLPCQRRPRHSIWIVFRLAQGDVGRRSSFSAAIAPRSDAALAAEVLRCSR